MRLGEHIAPLFRRARFYGNLPEVLELLRFRKLREAYYRDFWQRAAAEIGARSGEWPGGLGWIVRDGKTIPVKLYRVPLDDHLTVELLADKPLVLSRLQEIGCPLPQSCAFTMKSIDALLTFAAELGRPVAVKPARGAGAGRGVTTQVMGEAMLRKAAAYAARFSSDLLAEEHVEGSSFRLLYLHGRLIDAVRRDPPRLIGDGRRSIRGLIRAENRRRRSERPFTALSALRIDPDLMATLARQGLHLGSRPDKGVPIQAKHACNENSSRENHRVLDQVHAVTDIVCTRAVKALGTEFAGVDIICRDIALPLTRENGVIGEVNATPGLHHHDLIADPPRDGSIARIVLEHIFRTRLGLEQRERRASLAWEAA